MAGHIVALIQEWELVHGMHMICRLLAHFASYTIDRQQHPLQAGMLKPE